MLESLKMPQYFTAWPSLVKKEKVNSELEVTNVLHLLSYISENVFSMATVSGARNQ